MTKPQHTQRGLSRHQVRLALRALLAADNSTHGRSPVLLSLVYHTYGYMSRSCSAPGPGLCPAYVGRTEMGYAVIFRFDNPCER
jgi:hypothetical protein